MDDEATPGGTRARQAPALATSRRNADAVRRTLSHEGLLDKTLEPLAEKDRVVFPLVPDAPASPGLGRLRADHPGAEVTRRAFPAREHRSPDYRERLQHLDGELRALLPRAHDVVGDIAVIRIPAALADHKEEIGQALLSTRANLKSVAADHGVEGVTRVRGLETIAGEPRFRTIHREQGLQIEVDLSRAYFSPRLATERQRLLSLVRDGDRVLDLFAGVGAFVCLVARQRKTRAFTAVDVNPDAVALLRANLERNRIPPGTVDVVLGDARDVAPKTGDWDHVVLNLPHDAHRFLDVAAACVAPDGAIHLYAILERDEEDAYVHGVLAELESLTGGTWVVAERRHVRQYAPTMEGLGYSLVRASR